MTPLVALVLALWAAALPGCSKSEGSSVDLAAAVPAATPPPEPVSAANAAAASMKSVAAAPACGDKPLPPCPLDAWMKANTSPAMSSRDFDAMATALDKVVALAPPGYPNWAPIARDGAAAARSENYDGVRAACRGCHNQYKDKYKKEMRDRPI